MPAIHARNRNVIDRLSEREIDVLRSVGEGKSIRETAESLAMGEATVRAHRRAISQKLGENDRVRLARLALKLGLCSLDSTEAESSTDQGEAPNWLLACAMSASTIPNIVTSPEGRIRFVNDAAGALLEPDSDEPDLQGRSILDVFRSLSRGAVLDCLLRAPARKTLQTRAEIKRAGGLYSPVDVFISPVEQSGALIGLAISLIDVSAYAQDAPQPVRAPAVPLRSVRPTLESMLRQESYRIAEFRERAESGPTSASA